MTDASTAQKPDSWQAELQRAASTCATYYARRVPNWIAIGNRIWGTQTDSSPKVGLSLPDELMFCAQREIELRGEFTRRVLGEFAERSVHVSAATVLVECTALASELVRRGCRDVAKDIEHASRFLHGVDSECAERAISKAITSVLDDLVERVERRPDFVP